MRRACTLRAKHRSKLAPRKVEVGSRAGSESAEPREGSPALILRSAPILPPSEHTDDHHPLGAGAGSVGSCAVLSCSAASGGNTTRLVRFGGLMPNTLLCTPSHLKQMRLNGGALRPSINSFANSRNKCSATRASGEEFQCNHGETVAHPPRVHCRFAAILSRGQVCGFQPDLSRCGPAQPPQSAGRRASPRKPFKKRRRADEGHAERNRLTDI
jgi:hypothetical protein